MSSSSSVRYVHLTDVASDSEWGKRHAIKWDRSAEQLTCPCTSWKFARGTKRCKHTDYVVEQLSANGMTVRDAVRAVAQTSGAIDLRQPIAQDQVALDVNALCAKWGIVRSTVGSEVEALIRKHAAKPLAPAVASLPSINRPAWLGEGRALILRD